MSLKTPSVMDVPQYPQAEREVDELMFKGMLPKSLSGAKIVQSAFSFGLPSLRWGTCF